MNNLVSVDINGCNYLNKPCIELSSIEKCTALAVLSLVMKPTKWMGGVAYQMTTRENVNLHTLRNRISFYNNTWRH